MPTLFLHEAMLGKRKRDSVVKRQDRTAQATKDRADHQTLFKQYFEAQFQPLPIVEADTPSLPEGDSKDDGGQSEEADWEGLSQGEGPTPGIEVVVHTSSSLGKSEDLDPVGLRSFMVRPV
jgi:hypothetical protein